MKNKKLILVITRNFFYASLLVAVVVSCCGKKSNTQVVKEEKLQEYKIIVIDSCEYLQYYVKLKFGLAYTINNYQTKMITHKGNCKFCAERSKKNH
jgi:hypothetical protein